MDEKKKDLCRYRLEKAGRCLASAEVLAQSEDYCGSRTIIVWNRNRLGL